MADYDIEIDKRDAERRVRRLSLFLQDLRPFGLS